MDPAIIDGLTNVGISLLKVMFILFIGFITGNLMKKILMKLFEVTGILNLTKNNRLGKGLEDIGYHGGLLELIIDIMKMTIYLIAIIAALEIINLPEISNIMKGILIFIPRLISGIVIILFGILIADFIGKIIKEFAEDKKNRPHIYEINLVAAEFIQILLYFITVIMALQVIGLNMTVIMIVLTIILATMGVILVVSIQDFAPNYSASLYLHYSELKKGDRITTKKTSGIVEEIGKINTTIKTDHGTMKIPNRQLILNGFEKINNSNEKKEDTTKKNTATKNNQKEDTEEKSE